MSVAVRDSIRAISEDTWIVGNKLLLRREAKSPENIPDSDGDFSYALREVCSPLTSQQPSATIPFPLVYDAGDVHAVWKVGDSFLKIVIPSSETATREHVTLDTIHRMALGLHVSLPKVLYHGEWDGRYYLIVTAMPGQTLDSVWPQLSAREREECIDRISLFCNALSTKKANYIGGVDGRDLPESFLASKGDDRNDRFSHEKLLQNCKDLNMDCSKSLLCHCDLAPSNILLDLKSGSLSVIDFECVGYVPIDWIRTKFRLCAGLDLTQYDHGDEARSAWRSGMQKKLELEGFPDVAERWMDWRYP